LSSNDRTLDEIFTAALGLAESERDAYIRERCGEGTALRQRVLSLLRASETSDEPLRRRFDGIRCRLLDSVAGEEGEAGEDLSGRRVNAWQLEKRLARGGLATVYLARRADGAFDQTVAFKVLRRGLDTDDLVARFRAERQILFGLDHPSIARIYDGGALDDGRPYLVLEYVDGLPITTHCEQHGVGIRGRIRLLIDVLRALHHAHQHLIVHRDVKPSNILVSAEGRVALLDFGIAKLLDPEAVPGASTLTRTGVSLLTPGYGSPEQRAGQPVTTASDIYQVGLVIYELLSGKRPFDDVVRAPDADPPPPSHHLRGTAGFGAVKGDLDAITRKAMHVDPRERYASAAEMSADLGHYLGGRPVTARPDTLRYRLRKLTSRKPWLAPVVGLGVLAVALYIGTLTVYSQRLAEKERLAAAAQQFMVDLFRSPDPYAPADAESGRNITVVEALDIGRERVRTELADQPQLRASLLASISDVYDSLDQNRDAIALREEALALERELYGDRSEQVLASLRRLGGLYAAISEIERADAAFDEQLEIARAMYRSDAPELAVAEIAFATHARNKGDFNDDGALLEPAIDKLRKDAAHDPQILIDALIANVADHGMEDPKLALAAIDEADSLADTHFGPESLQAALVRIRLASTLTTAGDYAGSEGNFLEAIPVLEARLGKEHSSTLAALNNLGFLYSRRGDQAKAEQIHAELLQRQIAKHGSLHRNVADSYQNLAGAITHLGRYDESIPLHREAYRIYREVLNEDNFLIAFPLLSISYAELKRGNSGASEEAAREALQRFQATVPGSFLEGIARCLTGLALEQQGSVAEGAAMVEASHQLLRTGVVPEPYLTLCRLP
jgi:serine/threonine-protein kinase